MLRSHVFKHVVDHSRLSAVASRCLQRSFSSSVLSCSPQTQLTRAAASAAALRPRPVPNSQDSHQTSQVSTEALPDDLPITSMDDKRVAVGWDTRTWSRFHHIWLRDHCRCSECFHPITKQRLVNTFEIPPDLHPLHAESKVDGLQVTWPSASKPHVSFYPWSWLRHNSYDPPLQTPETEKILWGSKIEQSPPTVSYEELMANDGPGLFKCLQRIDKFGFSFVSGVPPTPEATEKLAERIGFIRETQYGKFWEFTSDLSKGDTAYTTLALDAHTDNTYFTDPCGLQLFHLLSHTDGSGGATLLVDGFYVASIVKELHPEMYDILSKVSVPAHAAGEQDSLYRPSPPTGYPVLRHDPVTRELIQVRWNNDDRSVMRHLQGNLVEDWYNAIRTWHSCLTSPDSEFWVQLTPGTAVIINNHRVLHGRSAFDGKRRMCGAYIGMDEFQSKLAVLSEKFSPNNALRVSEDGKNRSVWSAYL